MRTLTFLSLFLLLFAQSALSAPAVTNVTGALTHDGTITITGTGFGTKSPAAPVFWDECDAGSTNNMATYYSTAAGALQPLCSTNTNASSFSGALEKWQNIFNGTQVPGGCTILSTGTGRQTMSPTGTGREDFFYHTVE